MNAITSDILNLAYSCLIDGGTEHMPITPEEAAYTLESWQAEGAEMPGSLTPETFAAAWNEVLKQMI